MFFLKLIVYSKMHGYRLYKEFQVLTSHLRQKADIHTITNNSKKDDLAMQN